MAESPSSDLSPPQDDTSQAITAVEARLRDLIEELLSSHFGSDWIGKSSVDDDRVKLWRRRQDQDAERREGAKVTDRLILYSDLTDLKSLIEANWELFEACLGDRKTIEVYLDRLIDLRNPEKHARGLLPFERALAVGMSGEIRNKVTIYRSERGPDRQYFPQIEQVQDSFGHVARGSRSGVTTELILRPGDEIIFECQGWDPEGDELNWNYCISPGSQFLQNDAGGDSFTWRVSAADVADPQMVTVHLLSSRPYHRHGWYDDKVWFGYRVLPPG